jgi:hypothetical protein
MQRWSMSSTVSEIIIKLSNMKRLIIFVLTTVTLVAQFEHNTAHRLKYLQVSAIVDSMNTYRYHIADRLFEKHEKPIQIGVDISSNYQTTAPNLYSRYYDELHWQVSPYIHYQFSEGLRMAARAYVENVKDELLYPQRPYFGDEFAGMHAQLNVAYVEYTAKHVRLKLGRDYHMPGLRLSETLLFSGQSYSYDQFNLEFFNRWISFNSYYLRLNSLRNTDQTFTYRHLNGHRIALNIGDGYVAFNDILVYVNTTDAPRLALFNPFLFYYPYQKNNKDLQSNSIMSLEIFYNFSLFYGYGEFLLDDFQIDRDKPSDLEPTEYAIQLTAGTKTLIPKSQIDVTFTKIANRTFNSPNIEAEKYLYRDYPIGHFLGNNFWSVEVRYQYFHSKKLALQAVFSHTEFGEEALYGEFNKDYLNYTVSQGYSEDFPFGPLSMQSGFTLSANYSPMDQVNVMPEASWWLNNDLLEEDVTFKLGLYYNFQLNFQD